MKIFQTIASIGIVGFFIFVIYSMITGKNGLNAESIYSNIRRYFTEWEWQQWYAKYQNEGAGYKKYDNPATTEDEGFLAFLKAFGKGNLLPGTSNGGGGGGGGGAF